MTSTESRKTVRRSTATVFTAGRRKTVIVELLRDTITLRLHRERRRVSLPIGFVYTIALQSEVTARKAQRRAERAAKRKGKR